jgi:hypothetical protein
VRQTWQKIKKKGKIKLFEKNLKYAFEYKHLKRANMSRGTEERRKGVYVILETIGHDEKATEMPMLMLRKWLDQNLPGTQEGQAMRDGRILFLAKDEARVQKAEMNSRRLYDLCDNKVQRMDRMNQVQGTIFSRNMITEKEEDILEALKTYRCTNVE